jgi:predicted dinucleotide-binding enzyme
MRIGILGGGALGQALAYRCGMGGHDVTIGTRANGSYEAAAQQQVVFLTIAWPHAVGVVRGLRDVLAGRLLIDCTNPESDDGGLLVGWNDSGAETIARALPGTQVVKAFNALYAEHLQSTHPPASKLMTVLHCGDDALAKGTTAELIQSLGFDALDAGALSIARFLEPLAMLTVALVRKQNWGPLGIAWSVLREGDNEAVCETCGNPASLVSREKHILCGACFFLESQSRLASRP